MGPVLKKNARSGLYDILVPVPGGYRRGKNRWISTGERTRSGAEQVVETAGVDRLVLLAKANALTADAISIVTTGRKFTCDDLLVSWETDMRMDAASGTVDTYKSLLTAFFALIDCNRKPLAWVKKHHINDYVNDAGCKFASRHTRMAAVRSLWGYAASHAYIAGNLAETVHVKRKGLAHKQQESEGAIPLKEEEYQLLMNSPKVNQFWRRALVLGYRLGLRIGDVCRFQREQFTDEVVRIWTHKRGKLIELSLSDPLIGFPDLIQVLNELKMETPAGHCFPEQLAVINSKQRHHLSMKCIRLMESHGIKWKSFHSLRSSFGTHLKANGKTLLQIGKLLGHTREETTEGYIHEDKT